MKRIVVSLLATLLGLTVLTSCSGGASGYAYVFDGDTTTAASVDEELDALAGNDAFMEVARGSDSEASWVDGTFGAQITAAWVNQLVQYEAIDQALRDDDIEVTSQDRQSAGASAEQLFGGTQIFAEFPDWFREREIRREARKVAFLRSTQSLPTDAELRAYYDANVASLCPSGRLVSHVLVPAEAAAAAIVADLEAGADFAALARERGTDQSASAGGLLGCFTPGQFVPEFEAAAAALATGEVSAPVQTQFGWHVVKVDPVTFEGLRPQLAQALAQQASGEASGRVGRRLERADLKVNPRYGRIERSPEGLRVVAPRVPETGRAPASTSTTR
jgi:peptidyl-prolyl cis-trans isomerase C